MTVIKMAITPSLNASIRPVVIWSPYRIRAGHRQVWLAAWPSDVAGAAVGGEVGAGVEAGVVAGEEQDGGGDFLGAAEAAQRDQGELLTGGFVAVLGR